MLSSTDHDKLQQIIQEHPETEELFNRIFKSHQMDISTISHEIRNPLTLVYSTLQLIESQHPEVLEFAHWSELHQDIEYMKLLLEDLSSYNNGERLDLVPLSTGSFFRRIALSFASSIIDTDIEFTSYIPEDLPVLSADSVKLSLSLPVQAEEFSQKQCIPFFSGLLPEEDTRKKIADYLHISDTSTLKLLEALGGECAGMISSL